MHAVILTADGVRFEPHYPWPVVGAAEALVRVTLAGICGTDLELLRGYKGGFRGVLGHEFVGVVEAAPDAPGWVGRRVVASINLGCGACAWCDGAVPEHCPQRRVLGILGRDGVFAEQVAVPLSNLHAVPDDLPDRAAVFAEPVAAAVRLLQQTDLVEPERTLVLGPGRLGLLVAQVLRAAGLKQVTLAGRRPESLDLPRQLGFQARLAAELNGGEYPFVVDCTGRVEGFQEALRLVQSRGAIALKSTFSGAPAFDVNELVVREITLLGSRCGPFPPALELLACGAVEVVPLVAATYSLDQAEAALAHAARPGALKVLLQP